MVGRKFYSLNMNASLIISLRCVLGEIPLAASISCYSLNARKCRVSNAFKQGQTFQGDPACELRPDSIKDHRMPFRRDLSHSYHTLVGQAGPLCPAKSKCPTVRASTHMRSSTKETFLCAPMRTNWKRIWLLWNLHC